MQTISLFDAKNRLSALVDQVEDGAEVTITRRGKAVAKLVPVESRATQARQAVADLQALRETLARRGERFTWDEMKVWRDEGHR